jgi:hypothetical protein
MNNIVARYTISFPQSGQTPVLRSRTVVAAGEQALIVVSPGNTRTIPVDWAVDKFELTPDGEFVLALGDDMKRGAVWETRTGRKVIELTGAEGQRQSLRAGLVMIQEELCVLVAVKNKDIVILSATDGAERGWIATTGMIWFHFEGVIQLDPNWICITGYHDGESRDQIAAMQTSDLLQDPMALYSALVERATVSQWGYEIAAGPAGGGHAVVVRDPEWNNEEPSLDLAESFRGIEIWDLKSNEVVQRINYSDEFDSRAVIGADNTRVVIQSHGHVHVIARENGDVTSVEGMALDPYSLELATIQEDTISIAKL